MGLSSEAHAQINALQDRRASIVVNDTRNGPYITIFHKNIDGSLDLRWFSFFWNKKDNIFTLDAGGEINTAVSSSLSESPNIPHFPALLRIPQGVNFYEHELEKDLVTKLSAIFKKVTEQKQKPVNTVIEIFDRLTGKNKD